MADARVAVRGVLTLEALRKRIPLPVMREGGARPMIRVMPVSGRDEAIRLIKESRYGLTSSAWRDDLDPALAWTGAKDSGHGCTLSQLGIETFTRPKSSHLRLAT